MQRRLIPLTGAPYLPPIHTLGFHYSKYAPTSADIIRERNANFTHHLFPVDVLWMDIPWAQQYNEDGAYEYFKFNPANFTSEDIALMNSEIEADNRFITVILDPHLKVSDEYFGYTGGIAEEEKGFTPEGDTISIFAKKPASEGDEDYEANCWPQNSVWLDYFNESGAKYWGSLFGTDKFVGSNSRYYAWNDMNEPSVFDVESKTMPLDARFIQSDGRELLHRDVHNIYGAMQQRASYNGIKARDGDKLRPFVLTRCFFFGSWKWGAFWTGDNFAIDDEPYGAVKMIMGTGLSGAIFGGPDVPGFIGDPSDEVYIRMYQTGAWMPFFRAHSDINY